MSKTESNLQNRLALGLLAALVIIAPLFRAGKIPSAALVLELLAVCAFVVLWWNGPIHTGLGRWQKILLGCLVAFPLLQLVPNPGFSRESLPGQAAYYLAVALASPGADAGSASLSVLPRETLSGWLLLLIPVAVFLLTRALSLKQMRGVLVAVFVMAVFQAILGLVQFGGGPDSPFYLGMEHTHFGSAVGTYTSRNDYVGLLYLCLMVSLALFMATMGRQRRSAGNQTLRQRLVYLASAQGHRAFIYGAFSLLLLLAIVFTRSRGGIALTMLGILLASMLFSRRIGGTNVYGLTGTIASVVLALGIAIGLGPVLDRFSAKDPFEDGRWTIFSGTLDGIAQFFPLGAGSGTYVETFPTFQNLSQAAFTINRAHNSYLEWAYNGGLVAMVLIIAFLAVYIARWGKVWKQGEWGEFRYIQVGAGLGLLLMLLHETVGYHLFVPANMVYFAFFAGLFFYDYAEPVKVKRTRRSDQNSAATPGLEPSSRTRPQLQPVESETRHNPFMDEE